MAVLLRDLRIAKPLVAIAAAAVALWPGSMAGSTGPSLWSAPFIAMNNVVSTPTSGGGYAELPPAPGGCVAPTPNNFNANHSESELAVEPGTEQIVGSSKFFVCRHLE